MTTHNGMADAISSPGRYEGYNLELFDGFERQSQYVTARDGTRLAVDILIPTRREAAEHRPLPVILTATQYQRAHVEEGRVVTIVDANPTLRKLLERGYVIVALDLRGTGASFGTKHGILNVNDAIMRWDLHDVISWIGAQPWSDGNVGMYGISFVAASQIGAALTNPPYLKCIVPEQTPSSFTRALMNINGIQNITFRDRVDGRMRYLNIENPAPPVDEDVDGALLKAAVEQHRAQVPSLPSLKELPFTDSWSSLTNNVPHQIGLFSEWPLFAAAGTPVYHWGGWDDLFPDETLKMFKQFARSNPSRIVVGPWYHTEQTTEATSEFDYTTELLRWYDRYLKGIDNGIDREAPILYYLQDARDGQHWRTARDWPLPEVRTGTFYLDRGQSGTIASINDGTLSATAPAEDGAASYIVDYSLSTSRLSTRYQFGAPGDDYDAIQRGEDRYTDAAGLECKALTYTSEPLQVDTEITGHPVVNLLIRSDARDIDFFVVLADVAPSGKSRWVTEGMIRASDRALGRSPFETLGLPYHPGFAHLQKPLPADGRTVVPLAFEMLPTAKLFRKGHRIRITVYNYDDGNWLTPKLDVPPRYELMHRSSVSLPIVER
ncbi:MAG TPA: CocE/NonD family hydrolase [Novosphingobium sp.]